jgi:hypothetical protein
MPEACSVDLQWIFNGRVFLVGKAQGEAQGKA